uniref:Peptidase S8/S53 domain-containing protein n=1 Tax=Panagrolaimus davidi TaxID=227884 RepID=A0A914R273_9BILA
MGSLGLDFVAPGIVITDAPRFSYEKLGAYSGTSCAASNAAGAVACLLSGLKIEYSTKMIKFVLAKTAYLPKNRNKFEFGHGLIQIYDAFKYCQNHSKIDFNNKIPYPLPSAGGIHFMQNDDEKNTVTEREINLSQFIENDEPSKDVIENCTLEISPKTTENFIEFDGNNKFKIKIDTKNLEAGSLNFAEILIMDSEIGSIYNIPINVIYVLKVTKTHNYSFEKEITLNYENPYYLILYPYFESSTECKITITTLENSILDLCIKYMVRSESEETVKILDFIPNVSTQTHTISIEIKAFHEFCIFQKIGALPFVVLNLEFNFISD